MSNRSVEKCFEEAEETGTLSLHGRSLREFPACVDNYDLTDVMRVDISKNRFADLPHEIPTFFMLEKLDCSHNSLRCMTEVSHLHSLTFLNLSHNQLSSFPVHFCSLPIKILKASHNRLTSLPPEIGMMTQLQDLDVSCNELTSVPSMVGDISPLRVLNLRRNHLASLPDELSKLKNLLFLDFSCNKISVIPPAFRLITSLIKLDLKSNPLTSPPSQVCLKGRMHIFKYLSLAAQNQEKRWSMDRDIRRFKRTPSSTSASNISLLEADSRSNHIDDDRQVETPPILDSVDNRPRKGSLQEARSFFERELEKGRDVLIEDASTDAAVEEHTKKTPVKKLSRGSSSDAADKITVDKLLDDLTKLITKNENYLFVSCTMLCVMVLAWKIALKTILHLVLLWSISNALYGVISYFGNQERRKFPYLYTALSFFFVFTSMLL